MTLIRRGISEAYIAEQTAVSNAERFLAGRVRIGQDVGVI